MTDARDGGGAAWRQRQRRLRSWWRHEQQSIAAVLATKHHHRFAPRRQTTASTREGGTETHYTATIRETPRPPAEPGTQYFTKVDEEEEEEDVPELVGRRPAPVQEPRLPVVDGRHTGVAFEVLLVPQLGERRGGEGGDVAGVVQQNVVMDAFGPAWAAQRQKLFSL